MGRSRVLRSADRGLWVGFVVSLISRSVSQSVRLLRCADANIVTIALLLPRCTRLVWSQEGGHSRSRDVVAPCTGNGVLGFY